MWSGYERILNAIAVAQQKEVLRGRVLQCRINGAASKCEAFISLCHFTALSEKVKYTEGADLFRHHTCTDLRMQAHEHGRHLQGINQGTEPPAPPWQLGVRKKGGAGKEGGPSSLLCFSGRLMSAESGFTQTLLIYIDNGSFGDAAAGLSSELCVCAHACGRINRRQTVFFRQSCLATGALLIRSILEPQFRVACVFLFCFNCGSNDSRIIQTFF